MRKWAFITFLPTIRAGKIPGAFLCILLFFNSSFAQLKADFSANPVSGCAPLLVQFTDNSTGTPTNWKWDLGNGITSTSQNPSTVYLLPGIYTVKLVISNASGKDSLIRTNYITISQVPQVSFTTSTSTVGCFPLRVQFVDNSTPPSGTTIVAWEWDFGDGTTSSAQNPYKIYRSAGNFNVTLKVTSSNGCSNMLVKSSFIRSTQGVSPNFSSSTPVNCKPPENISFTNLTTGTGTMTYNWDFGDGGTSTLTNPSHLYSTAGNYSVTLIAASDLGCIDTITKSNQLNIGNYSSVFSYRNNVCINDTVGFFNHTSPNPQSFTWYFSDGTTSLIKNPIKIFPLTGSYTVKLVNNFGNCIDSSIRTIDVISNPVPDINADDSVSCKAPFTVHFTNTTPGATQWLWDFGDGTTSTLQNPAHTYTTEGSFTVKLTISASAGCTGSFTKADYIIVQKPVVTVPSLPGGGCFPYTFSPVANVVSADSVVSWLWNFGDGTTSTQQNPTHIYPVQGQYDVTLTITTSTGCTVPVTYIKGIKTGTKPTAAFSAAPLTSCAGKDIQFNDMSTNSPDEWLWIFGDNNTSTLQNPLHVYNDAGAFDIKLIVRRNGCPDSITKTSYINILPPVSKFSVNYNCNVTTTASFTDISTGPVTVYHWDFGDGQTSAAANPTHNYSATGTYKVILTVTNGSCSHTSQQDVTLLSLNPSIVSDQSSKCRNNVFNFSVTNVDPALIKTYLWQFDDGTTSSSATAAHGFSATGVHTITLTYTNVNNCTGTISTTVTVTGPTASFGFAPALQCTGSDVTFNNTSVTDGTNAITNVTWKFGDGSVLSTTTNPVTHKYTTASSYIPKLIVQDASGCTDSTLAPTVLDVIESKIDFTVADSLSCPGSPVSFINRSSGYNLSYVWDFGDGTTSVGVSPAHAYTASGIYTVKLYGTESIGCTDSVIKTNYITIDVPHANFIMSDSFTICPPIQVQFNNRSSYFRSVLWNFGDGNSSTDTIPKYSYSIPNTYIVTLTAVSPGGCRDTKQKNIQVLSNTNGTLTYNPLSGCYPVNVNFQISANSDSLNYLWDFGDGTTLFSKDSVLQFSYKYPGFYLPKIILQDPDGCLTPIIGKDTLKIFGSSADFSFDKTVLCDAGAIQFRDSTITADIITSRLWDFGDGTTSSQTNPLHVYAAPGTYTVSLSISTANGCTNSVTKNNLIKVSQTPVLSISGTTTYCTPASVSLQGVRTNADTATMNWLWNFDGKSFASQNISAYNINTAGLYPVQLIGTNSLGCTDTISNTITINQTPVVSAGNDTTICLGSSIILNPSGAATYIWSPGVELSCTNCTNPVAAPTSDRYYVVTGTSAQGCTDKDSVLISIKKPFTVTTGADQVICVGKSILLSAAGAEKYTWSPGTTLNDSTIAAPLASPIATTIYTVTGSDTLNCFTSTASVTVTVYPYPVVDAGRDTTIRGGNSVTLLPQLSADVSSVLWSPASYLTCTTCINPVASPIKTTVYRIVATNDGNCTAYDEVKITVLCDRNNIFIPNAFTPNNDGINDRFYVMGYGLEAVKNLRVYDRWGNIVFERSYTNANDPLLGWDGTTLTGQKAPPGMFGYVAEVVCGDGGIIPVAGSVILIR